MLSKFLIVFFIILLFAAFLIIPFKANSHLRYLKSIKKNEFERYNNYFQIMYRDLYYSVLLMLPIVIKIRNITHDKEAKYRLKRVRMYTIIYAIIYIFLIVYFILLFNNPGWYKS